VALLEEAAKGTLASKTKGARDLTDWKVLHGKHLLGCFHPPRREILMRRYSVDLVKEPQEVMAR